MNCVEWEEKIALYVGGELAESAAAEVEQHLGQCVGCQVFASGMQQSLEWLKSAHQDDLPAEAHFAAVRARVLAELAPRTSRRVWWWALAAGTVALAAAVLVIFSLRAPRATPRPEPVIAHAPEPASPPSEVQPTTRPRLRDVAGVRRHPRPKPVPQIEPEAAEPAKPLIVKLVTEDPNVVIYWITDTTDTHGGE